MKIKFVQLNLWNICRTIDNTFKLFHAVIAIVMANYFNGIEIPYSIEENEIIKIWKDFKEKNKVELAILSQEDILNNNSNIIF